MWPEWNLVGSKSVSVEKGNGSSTGPSESPNPEDLTIALALELDNYKVFEGRILPSDEAYVDIVVNSSAANGDLSPEDDYQIELKHLAILTSQDQAYSDENEDFTTVFFHELQYKGEEIWRLELDSHLPSPLLSNQSNGSEDLTPPAEYKSRCRLTKGYLELTIQKTTWLASPIGNDSRGTEEEEEEWEAYTAVAKKRLDLLSLLQGSAMAYEAHAKQEALEREYTIYNAESITEESFSEYIVEVSDDEEDDDDISSENEKPYRPKQVEDSGVVENEEVPEEENSINADAYQCIDFIHCYGA